MSNNALHTGLNEENRMDVSENEKKRKRRIRKVNETDKKKYTVSGKDAEYLEKALDRISVPYTRNGDSVSLLLSDEGIEPEKMIKCEKEMEENGYRFATVTFKTSINYPRLEKILKSVGTNAFFILEEDEDEAERYEDYDVDDPFDESRIPKEILEKIMEDD
jgi:hypothetical protein